MYKAQEAHFSRIQSWDNWSHVVIQIYGLDQMSLSLKEDHWLDK